jgi:hypothetical protein
MEENAAEELHPMRDVIAQVMRKTTSNKIFSFRLPEDLVATLACHAALREVSRNKMIETVLRDYVDENDRALRYKLTAKQQEVAGDEQIDLFA